MRETAERSRVYWLQRPPAAWNQFGSKFHETLRLATELDERFEVWLQ